MKKIFTIFFSSSLVLAIIVFSMVFFAMHENNNQGEIYDTVTGAYNIFYIASLFGALLIESFMVVAALYLLPALVMKYLAHRKQRRP